MTYSFIRERIFQPSPNIALLDCKIVYSFVALDDNNFLFWHQFFQKVDRAIHWINP